MENTVEIYFDTVKQTENYSVDPATGVITFAVPVPAGVVVAGNFDFDVPVWFESDSIGWRLEGYQGEEAIYRLESVFVQEGRIPLANSWQLEPVPNLSEEVLDLGFVFESVEAIEYNTSKENLPSGYVRRDANYDEPIINLNVSDRILERAELDLSLIHI